jgi:hypothetical protein
LTAQIKLAEIVSFLIQFMSALAYLLGLTQSHHFIGFFMMSPLMRLNLTTPQLSNLMGLM